MPRIFTRVPGAVVEVGCYGAASNDVSVFVPAEVGQELEAREDLRVEWDERIEVPEGTPVQPVEDGDASFASPRKKARKGEEKP